MRSTEVMVGMEGRTQDSCYELKLRVCSHEVERWVEQESQMIPISEQDKNTTQGTAFMGNAVC